MKIISEKSLNEFEFWSGAKFNASLFTIKELAIIEDCLTSLYPEGINETTLNDIFWFDIEWLAEIFDMTEDELLDRSVR